MIVHPYGRVAATALLLSSALAVLPVPSAMAQVTCANSGSTLTDCNQNGIDDACDVVQWTGFAAPVPLAVGPTPVGIVAADFNKDGFVDLAVPISGGATVDVLVNRNGTFTRLPIEVPTGPTALAVGDFNFDTWPDIAVATASDNSIHFLINTGPDASGNPTFSVTVGYPVGNRPIAMLATDMNNDGKLDVAVVNQLSNSINVLLNLGNWQFSVQQPQAVGVQPIAIATGDFDRDGKPDLAVANFASNNLSILVSSGALFPATPLTNVELSGPVGLAAADFDGDGISDLAVLNYVGGDLVILRNTGFGAFNALNPILVGNAPSAIVAADMFGTARSDLVIVNASTSGGTVTVWKNHGNGTFTKAQTIQAGTLLNSVVVANLLNDSSPDVAAADEGSNAVDILGAQVHAVAESDCNSNGVPDSCEGVSGASCSGGGGGGGGGGSGGTGNPACGAGSCGAGAATLAPLYLMGMRSMRSSTRRRGRRVTRQH